MSLIFGHNCDLLVTNLQHRLHSFIIRIWKQNEFLFNGITISIHPTGQRFYPGLFQRKISLRRDISLIKLHNTNKKCKRFTLLKVARNIKSKHFTLILEVRL